MCACIVDYMLAFHFPILQLPLFTFIRSFIRKGQATGLVPVALFQKKKQETRDDKNCQFVFATRMKRMKVIYELFETFFHFPFECDFWKLYFIVRMSRIMYERA